LSGESDHDLPRSPIGEHRREVRRAIRRLFAA
jgi:hypothetical protein